MADKNPPNPPATTPAAPVDEKKVMGDPAAAIAGGNEIPTDPGKTDDKDHDKIERDRLAAEAKAREAARARMTAGRDVEEIDDPQHGPAPVGTLRGKMTETAEGGRYWINHTLVNANGEIIGIYKPNEEKLKAYRSKVGRDDK